MSERIGDCRLVVTSVIRHAGLNQRSGFVRVVDFGRSTVLLKSPIESAYRANDPNSRGGLRGARGVATYGDQILISNAEQIMVLDSAWKLIGRITHPLMGGVHDILAEEDAIWATSASSDLLLKFDWNGKLRDCWEWRLDEGLRETFGLDKLPPVDRSIDYRNPGIMRSAVHNVIHLNAVTRGAEGLLLSFGRILSAAEYKKARFKSVLGSVAKGVGLKQRTQRLSDLPSNKIEGSSWAAVLLRDDGRAKVMKRLEGIRVPNHNIVQVGDMLVYNNTNGNRVVATSLNNNMPERVVNIPGNPGFVRGMAQLDRNNLFVGSQKPAAIYQVDLLTESILANCLLDGEPNETVYAVCILPGRFNDPPAELEL